MSAETSDNIETIGNKFNHQQQQQPQSPRQVQATANINADNTGNVIGLREGKLVCHTHNFETFDTNEFDQHKEETGHTISGAMPCSNCKQEVLIDDIPFKQNMQVFCPNCLDEINQSHSQSKGRIQLRSEVEGAAKQQ